MLRENEVVMLVLGIGVLILIFTNLDHIRRIKFWKILLSGYCILLLGWVFTVLEGFFIENFFNLLEHGSYLLSSLFIAVWAWKSTGRKNREDNL